jgi:hypothetical protein
MEAFRPVFGYEGVFEVSSTGIVRRTGREKHLKPGLDRHGYPHVNLNHLGVKKYRSVHSLVAEAFICPRPEGKQVNHIDGNKKNPCAENLEWVTAKGNKDHAVANRLVPLGEKHWKSTITESDVHKIRRLRYSGFTYRGIAEKLSINLHTAYAVFVGRTWKHVPEVSADVE